ncbi:hypothetical protein GCM10010191_12700 [Actinomadura vinacea]|uniref:ParB/Sulfiredoxin domain-containing protein n=1 Tax=Actinomadura vinacea TaxID=115336 RepID=A0ABN3IJ05_9ACTN
MFGDVPGGAPGDTSGNTPDRDATGQMFVFLGWAWDVDKAARLAARHPVMRADITRLGWARPVINVDPVHAATVDLSRPLLAVPVPNAAVPLVIDGYHRIHRAITERVTELPVILLDAADERACRIMGGGITPIG